MVRNRPSALSQVEKAGSIGFEQFRSRAVDAAAKAVLRNLATLGSL